MRADVFRAYARYLSGYLLPCLIRNACKTNWLLTMVLLQAGIAFGMFVTAVGGLLLLTGTPILTYVISRYLSNKQYRTYLAKQRLPGSSTQKPPKMYLFRSFLLALLLLLSILVIGTCAFLMLAGDLG